MVVKYFFLSKVKGFENLPNALSKGKEHVPTSTTMLFSSSFYISISSGDNISRTVSLRIGHKADTDPGAMIGSEPE